MVKNVSSFCPFATNILVSVFFSFGIHPKELGSIYLKNINPKHLQTRIRHISKMFGLPINIEHLIKINHRQLLFLCLYFSLVFFLSEIYL